MGSVAPFGSIHTGPCVGKTTRPGEQRDNFGRLLLLVSTPTSLFGIVADISLIVERGYGVYIATPCLVITSGITLASAWAVLSAAAEEVSDRLRA